MKILLTEALTSGLLKPVDDESKTLLTEPITEDDLQEPPSKKQRSDKDKEWVKCDGLTLLEVDREELCNGMWLSDKHIDFAQKLLKKQFQQFDEWNSAQSIGNKKLQKIKHGIQVIHTCGNHWIVVSNLTGCI